MYNQDVVDMWKENPSLSYEQVEERVHEGSLSAAGWTNIYGCWELGGATLEDWSFVLEFGSWAEAVEFAVKAAPLLREG
jgi:hypothetical protein